MNNNIERNIEMNIDKKEVKVPKVAFSGKVLPSTSEEFEKLFESIEKEEGKKLQFEEKLQKLISMAKEKMLDDELKVENEQRKEFELNIETEKEIIASALARISDSMKLIETTAKQQILDYKTKLASDVLGRTKTMNTSTIGLLEDFQEKYDTVSQENQRVLEEKQFVIEEKDNALLELEEAKARIQALEEQLEVQKIKTEKVEESLIKARNTIEEKDTIITKVQEKYNSQLEKNDELRDTKDFLEKELKQIHEKHSIEISKLKQEIQQKDSDINELKSDVKVFKKEIEILTVNLKELKEVKKDK